MLGISRAKEDVPMPLFEEYEASRLASHLEHSLRDHTSIPVSFVQKVYNHIKPSSNFIYTNYHGYQEQNVCLPQDPSPKFKCSKHMERRLCIKTIKSLSLNISFHTHPSLRSCIPYILPLNVVCLPRQHPHLLIPPVLELVSHSRSGWS